MSRYEAAWEAMKQYLLGLGQGGVVTPARSLLEHMTHLEQRFRIGMEEEQEC